jgi:hypothetical protein
MLKVTVHNLKEFKNKFIDFLGAEFINELEGYNPIGLKEANSEMMTYKAHPLAIWWRIFKEDIHKSESSNTLMLSPYSIRILDLLENLNTAKNIPNFNRIIDSIISKGKFYSGVFEVYVAAGYCTLGYDVEAIEENQKIGVQTPDILIKLNEQKIFVECKSLDDPSIKETPLWNNLCKRLSNALEKYHRSWMINIFAAKQINGKTLEIVLKLIFKDIKLNDMSQKSFLDDVFHVEYSKIAEWDKSFTLPLEFPKKGEIGIVEAEIHNPQGLYRKLRAINILPHTEFEISKRLINEFKKAKQQIPKEEIGIIHICIPYKEGSKLLQAVDNSYDKLYNEINFNTQRINAVVISSTVLETIPESPITSHYYIVPNITTRNNLPNNFAILGTNESFEGLELNADEGTIEFEFIIPKDKEKQLPFFIFQYSSRDGKSMIQVWKTWSDKLRMDIFTPSIGRVFVETESINLPSDKIIRFAGTYGKDNINVFINGNKINSKKI